MHTNARICGIQAHSFISTHNCSSCSSCCCAFVVFVIVAIWRSAWSVFGKNLGILKCAHLEETERAWNTIYTYICSCGFLLVIDDLCNICLTHFQFPLRQTNIRSRFTQLVVANKRKFVSSIWRCCTKKLVCHMWHVVALNACATYWLSMPLESALHGPHMRQCGIHIQICMCVNVCVWLAKSLI